MSSVNASPGPTALDQDAVDEELERGQVRPGRGGGRHGRERDGARRGARRRRRHVDGWRMREGPRQRVAVEEVLVGSPVQAPQPRLAEGEPLEIEDVQAGMGELARVVAGLFDRARRAGRALREPLRHLRLGRRVELAREARQVVAEGAVEHGEVAAGDDGVGEPRHDPEAVVLAHGQVVEEVDGAAAGRLHLDHRLGVGVVARSAARLVGRLHVVEGPRRVRRLDRRGAVDPVEHLRQRVPVRPRVAEHRPDQVLLRRRLEARRAREPAGGAVEGQRVPARLRVVVRRRHRQDARLDRPRTAGRGRRRWRSRGG